MDRRGFLVSAGALGLGAVAGCSRDDDRDAQPTQSATTSPSTTAPKPSPSSTSVDVKVADTIASGLNVPWGIAFLPSGDALVSQRDAHVVVRVSPSGRTTEIGEIAGPSTAGSGESGLLGIAVDPDDATQLYAYVSTASDNRVVRVTYDGRRLTGRRTILAGIPVGLHHNGGRLLFGADGSLYVSTGESGDPSLSQDRSSLGGKVLRITRDGDPARGNPFDSPVWTYGHRNVEGLAFDADGRLWASEFGEKTADELNHLRRGRNYGWPRVEGRGSVSGLTNPAVTWSTDECSPAGIAITRSHAFLGALKGQSLWVVPLDGARAGTPRRLFQGEYGRLRSVAVAPSGDLWLTTSNTDGRQTPGRSDDRILRVTL